MVSPQHALEDRERLRPIVRDSASSPMTRAVHLVHKSANCRVWAVWKEPCRAMPKLGASLSVEEKLKRRIWGRVLLEGSAAICCHTGCVE